MLGPDWQAISLLGYFSANDAVGLYCLLAIIRAFQNKADRGHTLAPQQAIAAQ